VNGEHLRAFLWLRWRLMANQWRRGGALNAMLMTIVAAGLLVMVVPLFAGSFALGIFAFPKATPEHLLYAWDAMIASFVFLWSIGLMTELQRTETLSLSKFLHLPVSPKGAFVINYVSSLLQLTLIVFVPVLFGFGLALVYSRGALFLSVLPLTAAFLLMVTALTYQFQGWLAALMINPRRRRTVVVATTAVLVLIFQLPNLLRFSGPWSIEKRAEESAKFADELAALNRRLQAGEFDAIEHLRRQQELLEQHELATQEVSREDARRLRRTAMLLNLALPVGWLPLGVMNAAEGKVVPAVLGSLGMSLIGAAGLWRAYRTTIGLYQGRFIPPKRAAATAVSSPTRAHKPGSLFLERRLPGLSEPVSAIALGSLRSLMRSPESKMMLLTPLLMSAVFGSMILRLPKGTAGASPVLLAIGAIGMALFGASQLMANQFGFDRDGFRVYVLCAAARRDILLGKNVAFAPLVLGMAAILLAAIRMISPMRFDHFLSMLPQSISMFLLYCMLMNVLSILAPMHIAAGSLKPTSVRLTPVLLQLAAIVFIFPLIEAPTLLPLAIEMLLEWQGWTARMPVCLLLSLVECAAVVAIYCFALNWQGRLLREREQTILDTVTNRAA
jgi:ABC-2 type transport system permease protein